MPRHPTLTELILIAGFLTVATAIAIPILLAYHEAAEEAAAATTLTAILFPAELQFQAAGYVNPDHHDSGRYATATTLGPGRTYPMLSGQIPTPTGEILILLPPTFRTPTPVINGYRFEDPVSATAAAIIPVAMDISPFAQDSSPSIAVPEPIPIRETWALIIRPIDAYHGKHLFAINQSFTPVMSNPDDHAWSNTTKPTDPHCFGTNLQTQPDHADWQRFPYPY